MLLVRFPFYVTMTKKQNATLLYETSRGGSKTVEHYTESLRCSNMFLLEP